MSRKVELAFGSAILALLVVGVISYRGMVVSAESNRWVRHSHEVLENLEDSFSAMQAVESSYRGFVITGDEQFLQPYRESVLRSEQEQTIIRNLTVDNPEQRRQLLTLERLADQKIQYAETIIGLRRTKGWEAAADSIRTGEGQRTMMEYRDAIRRMQDEELRLLVIRAEDAKRRLGQTKIVLILGTVLGLLIAAGGGWSVQRGNSARGLAEDALREAEERFRTLANNIAQLAWMADEHGYIFWYNQRWFDYTGTTLEEMAGWGWQKVLPQTTFRRLWPISANASRAARFGKTRFPFVVGMETTNGFSRGPFPFAIRRGRYRAGSARTPTSATARKLRSIW